MPSLPSIDGWEWKFNQPTKGKWSLQQTYGSINELTRRLTATNNLSAINPAVRNSISGSASVLTNGSVSPPASPASAHSAVVGDARPTSIRQAPAAFVTTTTPHSPPPTAPVKTSQELPPPPYTSVHGMLQTNQPYGTLGPRPHLPAGYTHDGLPTGPPFLVSAYPSTGFTQHTVGPHPSELQTHSSLRIARRPVSSAHQQQVVPQELQAGSANASTVQQYARQHHGHIVSHTHNLSTTSFSSGITQHTTDQVSCHHANPQTSIAELPAPLSSPPTTMTYASSPPPLFSPPTTTTYAPSPPPIVSPIPLQPAQHIALATPVDTPVSAPSPGSAGSPVPNISSPSLHPANLQHLGPTGAITPFQPTGASSSAQGVPQQPEEYNGSLSASHSIDPSPVVPLASLQPMPLHILRPASVVAPTPVQSPPPHPAHDPGHQMLSLGSPYGHGPQQSAQQTAQAAQPQLAHQHVQPIPGVQSQSHFHAQPQLQVDFQQHSQSNYNFDPKTGKPLRPSPVPLVTSNSTSTPQNTTSTQSMTTSQPSSYTPLQHVYSSPDVAPTQASEPQSSTQLPSQTAHCPTLAHTMSAPQVLQTQGTTSPAPSTKHKLLSMGKGVGAWAGKGTVVAGKWIAENPNAAKTGVTIAQFGSLALLGVDLRKEGRAAHVGIQKLKVNHQQQQAQASAQVAAGASGQRPPQLTMSHQPSSPPASTLTAQPSSVAVYSPAGPVHQPNGGQHNMTQHPGMTVADSAQAASGIYQASHTAGMHNAHQQPMPQTLQQNQGHSSQQSQQTQQSGHFEQQQQMYQQYPQQQGQMSSQQQQQQQFIGQYSASQHHQQQADLQQQFIQQYNAGEQQQFDPQCAPPQQQQYANQTYVQPQYDMQNRQYYMVSQPSNRPDQVTIIDNSVSDTTYVDPSTVNQLLQFASSSDSGSQTQDNTQVIQDTEPQNQILNTMADSSYMMQQDSSNDTAESFAASTTSVTTNGNIAVFQQTNTDIDVTGDGSFDACTETDTDVVEF